jgi:hypothetical protein
VRSELEISAAVAREAAVQLHVTCALRLIELAADRSSASRALRIYVRLHGFGETEAAIVSSRVLAQLGKRAARSGAAPFVIEGEEDLGDEPVSLVRAVRERLRGRIHVDLRRWIELHTGASKLALLELHVRHAEGFARELTATHSIAEAAQVYVDLVGIPPALREMLYLGITERLAEEELPRPQTQRSDPAQIVPRKPPFQRGNGRGTAVG